MHNLLYQQIDAVLANAAERKRLTSENALRVGATTLSNSHPGEVSATTIVCDDDLDEVNDLECIVAGLAAEFGLEATIQYTEGSYSVRFTRRRTARPPRPENAGTRARG